MIKNRTIPKQEEAGDKSLERGRERERQRKSGSERERERARMRGAYLEVEGVKVMKHSLPRDL